MRARPGCGSLHDSAARRPPAPAGGVRSGKCCSPAIFLRTLPGTGAASPDPAAASPRPGCGWGGLSKVTPAAAGRRAARSKPGQARPDSPPGAAQPGSPRPPHPLEGRLPPPARRAWARGSPPRAPAPSRRGRRRARGESARPAGLAPLGGPGIASGHRGGPGCVLTAAGTRCLSPPARGRPMSERGCPGDATRPWLLRRNSVVFLPPSRASAPPRGRGLSAALSGRRGRARAAGGRGGRLAASRWPAGCGGAGPHSLRGAPPEAGVTLGAV